MKYSRPITRKNALNKIALEKLDLAYRQRYIQFILALDPYETELIFCDEIPVDFGGSGNEQYVLAPRSEDHYASVEDPRFSLMQWDSMSSFLDAKRHFAVWKLKSDELTAELAKGLSTAQRLIDEYTEYQIKQASIKHTPEWTEIEEFQR